MKTRGVNKAASVRNFLENNPEGTFSQYSKSVPAAQQVVVSYFSNIKSQLLKSLGKTKASAALLNGNVPPASVVPRTYSLDELVDARSFLQNFSTLEDAVQVLSVVRDLQLPS